MFSRYWPKTLHVYVVAKDVRALFFSKQGQMWLVADDGSLLSLSKKTPLPDLVVLRGERLKQNKELRQQAIGLLESLPSKGLFSEQYISDVGHTLKEGFWLSLVGSGTQVLMGQGRVEDKIKRINRVLDYVDVHKIESRTIDARLSKKVLVKLRKTF